jgi:uncharacterized protein (TIGR02996 family)
LGERDAFHAAIWKAPDDDLPRLVYADWLDERGEGDAAAFLRLLSAVRTCPPDVDRLRPLVADFRRAMVKLPAEWVEDVCPVPPAVVVGAWVDVDRKENVSALQMIRNESRGRWRSRFSASELLHRPARCSSFNFHPFVEMTWEALLPVLSPAAVCEINGVPVLVDVWSGVVMAVATNVRPDPSEWWVIYVRNPSNPRSGEWAVVNSDPSGPLDDLNDMFANPDLLREAAAEFDPANRLG